MRLAPSGVDHASESLETSLILEWIDARGLLDATLDRTAFMQIVHNRCYGGRESFVESGKAAGNLWCFLRETQHGDPIVAPITTTLLRRF